MGVIVGVVLWTPIALIPLVLVVIFVIVQEVLVVHLTMLFVIKILS